MKRTLIFLYSILIVFEVSAQDNNSKEIGIGKTLPDIPLGKVMDNSGNVSSAFEGKKSFSNFKGKLIILDFWSTSCASCIEGFPKMSRLQEKYKNQIQIFLVNGFQDEVKLNRWLKLHNKKRFPEKIIPDNLPIIANAKELLQLFPIRGEIGYHAWIGPDGKVKLRGISENTNEQKIDQLLNGREITFVQDNALIYNTKLPYFKTNIGNPLIGPIFSSNFGLFDDSNASAYGVEVSNYADSITGTVRNSYINTEILQLYRNALKAALQTDSTLFFGDPIVLEVKNKALITLKESELNRAATDEDYRYKVSYEQIVPSSLPDSTAKEFMLADLNRFLNWKYGINGYWEERTVECIKLVSTNGLNQIKSETDSKNFSFIYKDGAMFYDYKGYPLRSLFKNYFKRFNKIPNLGSGKLIIDGVGSDIPVDLTLPDPYNLEDYDQLLNELKKAGFLLVDDSIKRDIFVIKQ